MPITTKFAKIQGHLTVWKKVKSVNTNLKWNVLFVYYYDFHFYDSI